MYFQPFIGTSVKEIVSMCWLYKSAFHSSGILNGRQFWKVEIQMIKNKIDLHQALYVFYVHENRMLLTADQIIQIYTVCVCLRDWNRFISILFWHLLTKSILFSFIASSLVTAHQQNVCYSFHWCRRNVIESSIRLIKFQLKLTVQRVTCLACKFSM